MSERRGRTPYVFSKELRHERLNGCEHKCEMCGKATRSLEVHHIFGAWLASQNEAVSPAMIKVLENELCLCKDCHNAANEQQHHWDAHELGLVAWSLFDANPYAVEAGQKNTYKELDEHTLSRRTSETKKKRSRRYAKKRSRR